MKPPFSCASSTHQDEETTKALKLYEDGEGLKEKLLGLKSTTVLLSRCNTARINPLALIGIESFVTPAVTLNVCDSVDDDESVTVAAEVAKTTAQNLSNVYSNRLKAQIKMIYLLKIELTS